MDVLVRKIQPAVQIPVQPPERPVDAERLRVDIVQWSAHTLL